MTVLGSTQAAPNITNATTGAFDTTGATLLAIWVSGYNVNPNYTTPTDSKSNTWAVGPHYKNSNQVGGQWFYCLSPTVGSGHTFSMTTTGQFATFYVAWADSIAASAFDGSTGAGSTSGTSLASGSITPTQAGDLILSGHTSEVNTTYAVDSGMTVLQQTPYVASTHEGGALAWVIQGAAAAINPSWSWTGSTPNSESSVIAFKSTGGGGGFTSRAYYDSIVNQR
jgi:hypothetical protein